MWALIAEDDLPYSQLLRRRTTEFLGIKGISRDVRIVIATCPEMAMDVVKTSALSPLFAIIDNSYDGNGDGHGGLRKGMMDGVDLVLWFRNNDLHFPVYFHSKSWDEALTELLPKIGVSGGRKCELECDFCERGTSCPLAQFVREVVEDQVRRR